MTKRQEFSTKIRDQAALRAGDKCQICGMPFAGKRKHFDHILPCALDGQPTLANCSVVCEPCHKAKTGQEDVPRIRKADRQRRAHLGARRPKALIKSRGFDHKPRPEKLPMPPRRSIYEDAKR